MRNRRRIEDYSPAPLEEQEQIWLLEWVELNTPAHPELALFYHIPNEGKRSYRAGRELVKQGLKKGVPDNCLPVPRGKYAALYIELKRKRGSKVSEDQRGWIDALNRAGNRAVICKGWEAAAAVIMEYIKGGAQA